MRSYMRHGATAALAVSALFLTTACGGSSDDSSAKKPAGQDKAAQDTTKKDDAASAVPLTAAQMKAATVEVKDLPSGWKTDKPTAPATDAPKADKPECQPIADLMADEVPGATMGTNADFSLESDSTLLSQQVLTYSGAGAADWVKSIGSAAETCTSFTIEQEGEKLEIKVEKLTDPQIGESSSALRMNIEIPSVSMKFESDVFVAQQGTGATRVAYVPADAAGHKDFADLAKRTGDKFVKGAQS
ncbi:hypothetical protein [Streptomyces sp. NPDC059909]|uniref:hypothetical protein n=1 Tax=Streptomyces sp. NPDC059909 TaxID=3346998 RepID=UPI0036638F99